MNDDLLFYLPFVTHHFLIIETSFSPHICERQYVTRAAEIDPNYCDIHQQFSSIYFQQKELTLFENHLTDAVLCPFTMIGAQQNFQQY